MVPRTGSQSLRRYSVSLPRKFWTRCLYTYRKINAPPAQEFQRILSRCLDILYSGTNTPSGLQTEVDYLLIIKSFESQMESWRNDWVNYRGAWGSSES
jgi:hypothetical protein